MMAGVVTITQTNWPPSSQSKQPPTVTTTTSATPGTSSLKTYSVPILPSPAPCSSGVSSCMTTHVTDTTPTTGTSQVPSASPNSSMPIASSSSLYASTYSSESQSSSQISAYEATKTSAQLLPGTSLDKSSTPDQASIIHVGSVTTASSSTAPANVSTTSPASRGLPFIDIIALVLGATAASLVVLVTAWYVYRRWRPKTGFLLELDATPELTQGIGAILSRVIDE